MYLNNKLSNYQIIKRSYEALIFAYGETTKETVLKCLQDQHFLSVYVDYKF